MSVISVSICLKSIDDDSHLLRLSNSNVAQIIKTTPFAPFFSCEKNKACALGNSSTWTLPTSLEQWFRTCALQNILLLRKITKKLCRIKLWKLYFFCKFLSVAKPKRRFVRKHLQKSIYFINNSKEQHRLLYKIIRKKEKIYSRAYVSPHVVYDFKAHLISFLQVW